MLVNYRPGQYSNEYTDKLDILYYAGGCGLNEQGDLGWRQMKCGQGFARPSGSHWSWQKGSPSTLFFQSWSILPEGGDERLCVNTFNILLEVGDGTPCCTKIE